MHIKNANIFLPDGHFRHGSVYFTDIIEELGEFQTSGGIDAENGYLLPGLFDVHTHGAVGFDFSDGVPEQLPALARHYARYGVTSFLATTMTLPEETLTTAVKSISAFVPGENEASCMGIHLEGPFLSRAKCGAQNPAYLKDPDIDMFRRIDAASGNRMRLVDVAPELPGALDFIREASKICTVSLAHSAADYDTAVRGYESGATEATHLFNGMPPFHHRNPGVVGAAIDKKAYAEIISDGIHLHPAVVRAAFALFPASAMLISDSLRCAGMPEGTYTLGGQEFTLKDGRKALLRAPEAADAAEMNRYLKTCCQETEFLLRCPEECVETDEQEAAFLEAMRSNPLCTMVVCTVDGEIAGNSTISFNKRIKVRHRASIGTSVLGKFWNLGIGTAMFREMIDMAKRRGVTQLNLDYLEGNDRAKGLYEKMGFHAVCEHPDAILLSDGKLCKEISMIMELSARMRARAYRG